MSSARHTAAAALVLAAVALSPTQARAQANPQSPELLAILLAPPALAALLCDVINVGLLTNGSASRGIAITGTVFGGVTTLFAFIALAAGISSAQMFSLWVPAGGVGMALGLGSIFLGLYGITHPQPEPETTTGVRRYSAADGFGPRPTGDARLVPMVWADRGGVVAGGMLNVAL